MTAVVPTAIPTVPTGPTRSDRTSFNERMEVWVTYLNSTLPTASSSAANDTVTNATHAETEKNTAIADTALAVVAQKEVISCANAASVSNSATTAMWVSGSYNEGEVVWSPTDYQNYRSKSTGAATTDPAADSGRWALITPGGAGTWWETKTADYTAAAGDNILVDTTSSAINITLPASPNDFDVISLADAQGTFHLNKLVVLRNGKKIMGLSENMDVQTRYISFRLTYEAVLGDWRLT